MWVARDEDGYLSAYHHKPIRGDSEWGACEEDSYYVYKENGEKWYGIDISIPLSEADYKTFEFLKWEDEPIEVKLISTNMGSIKDAVFLKVLKEYGRRDTSTDELIRLIVNKTINEICG